MLHRLEGPAVTVSKQDQVLLDQMALAQQRNRIYEQESRAAHHLPTSLKQIGVRVWSPDQFRKTELDVANLPISAPDGHTFPLQRIAGITPVTGQPQITRENLQHMVPVTARLEGLDLGSAAAEVARVLDQPGFLPKSIRYELGGLYAQQQIAFRALLMVFCRFWPSPPYFSAFG